jgi:HK97 family phage major capsid protein
MGAYINVRLLQGLKVVEDAQILTGDGTDSNLRGILTAGNHVAAPGAVSGDSRIDRIPRVFAALAADEMVADGVLGHPNEWAELQLVKTTDGDSLLGSPGAATGPNIWCVRVIASTAIADGTFLVGSLATVRRSGTASRPACKRR